MKAYAVTLRNEDGPYFNINADCYEIFYSTLNHRPLSLIFRRRKEIICEVTFHYIYELAEIRDDEYIKIDLSKEK